MIDQTFALVAAIAAVTALAFWLDRRYAWARKVGATLLVIAFGAVLSNLGIVPAASPVYDAITGPITSLAIVWLLFAVDLRDLRAAGPRMLGAFAIAASATVMGALAATLTFGDAFGDDAWRLAGVMTGTYSGGSLNFVAVGRELGLPDTLFTAATAADNVLTALWMGATLMLPLWLGRFYPAAQPAARRTTVSPGDSARQQSADDEPPRLVPAGGTSDVPSPEEQGTGLTAPPDGAAGPLGPTARGSGPSMPTGAESGLSTGTSGQASGLTSASGAAEGRHAMHGGEPHVGAAHPYSEHDRDAAARSRQQDAMAAGEGRRNDGRDAPEHPFFGAASLRLLDITLLLALGFGLLFAADAVAARVPAIPSVLWLTTFALTAAQLPAVRRLSGAMQLGTLALHFFFVVIGIGSRVAEIARVGPEIFYLTAMVVAIHGVLTYGAARVARLDVATVSVASQAAVGGPSSALALAVAREWPALVLPGTVAGLLGYAVGNYLGLGVAYLVRAAIGA